MLDYLNAKIADYAIILGWIDRELKELKSSRPRHHQLIERLQEKLKEAQVLHAQLQIIASVGDPMLTARALPIIHDIELSSILVSYWYIPALRRETGEDLDLRDIDKNLRG